MLMRSAHLAMRGSLWGLAIAVFLLWRVALCAAQPTATDVCVIMTGSNGQVSGLQLDLSWDPTCMTAERGAGDAAKCAANPGTGKSVQTKLFPNNATLRALFLSMSDTSPVPDDELFCCRFTLAQVRSNPCCVARIENLILANPSVPGGRIYDAGISVQALVGNTPCAASAPGGSPSAPVRPPLPSAAAPAAPAPVVAVPGAEPPVAQAPILPGPNPQAASGTGHAPITGGQVPGTGPIVAPPGGVPAAAGQMPAAAAEATPIETVGLPSHAARRTATARRTRTAATPTPGRTPQAQRTTTAAAVGSVTPAASTPTPATTGKHRRKKVPQ